MGRRRGMPRPEFERLVERALRTLPRPFKDRLANIAVVIEDWADDATLEEMGIEPPDTLYGLYRGVDLTHRDSTYGAVLPDVVTIYQGPIEEDAADEAEMREIVRETVVHELGHYFGLDDETLHRIEDGEDLEDARLSGGRGGGMRSGAEYLDGLRDGRVVLLDGERVADVTKHPAFAGPIRRIAETYDLARGAEGREATFVDAATGRRHGTMWLVPRSAEDLGARRRAHRLWAEPSYGLMGRTPDHVACVLTAFAAWRQLFDRGGARFGDNVVRFHARARDEDLYVTYGIVPLQIDRSQPAHRQPEPFLFPGVVAERDDGIVVRGCQGITTSAVLADWMFISYIVPLGPGDEDYAISFVTPVAAPGVRLHPRRPYAFTGTGVYDYPLSSRFDEVDATVVFDDVFVPWEHVFIHRNVELVNAQFHESPSHTLANFQSLVRFGVKLEFTAGLALKLVEVHRGERRPDVVAALGGDVAALAAAFDALVQAAERNPLVREGVARPHPQYVYAGMSLQRRLVVDLMRAVRELAGGAFQQLPSSAAAFAHPEARADFERYFRSPVASARERVKLLKLVWDLVGTEFAGRQLQYEMFYSAPQPVVNARMFRAYDWPRATALVDRCLAEYD